MAPHVFQVASCVTWMGEIIPMTTPLSASVLEGMSYVGPMWEGSPGAGWCTVGGTLHSSLLTPLALPAGLTPFLVKLLDDEDLTAKQALHLLDLQLREQVTAASRGYNGRHAADTVALQMCLTRGHHAALHAL